MLWLVIIALFVIVFVFIYTLNRTPNKVSGSSNSGNDGTLPSTTDPILSDPNPSFTVPSNPLNVEATAFNGQAVVTFIPPINNGGSPITSYTVISEPDNIIFKGESSPITVYGLRNEVSYTFRVVATNAIGNSDETVTLDEIIPTNYSNSAPTITSVYPTTNSIIVYFTAPTSFGTLTNYEYSIDNGVNFTPLSPVDTSSPITISSLLSSTLYNIAIRAINNVPEIGDTSNIVPVKTATEEVWLSFTDVGNTSWTVPDNVRGIQYLVVGAGGGGGGCYSKIIDLGNVPVQSTPPINGGYWIYNGTSNANYTYARMYNGTNTNVSGGISTFTEPIRLTASETTNIPPGGNDGTRWHGNKEVIYYLKTTGNPTVSNYGLGSYIVGSGNNLPSGGSGGGAAGQIKAIFNNTQYYSVIPGTTYNITVGDGGDGGIATVDTENAGSKGGDSVFDTIISEGGSGGQPSRVLTVNSDGYYDGGKGGQNGTSTLREGQGGQGAGGAGQQQNVTVGGYGGAASGVGFMGQGAAFSGGGSGGAPNVIASGTTIANRGYGGKGTGATLNSFAYGIKGGSGLVKLHYYI